MIIHHVHDGWAHMNITPYFTHMHTFAQLDLL